MISLTELKNLATMSLTTNPGDEVIFAFPGNGREWCRQLAAEHLTVGGIYAVDSIEIHDWSSTVRLEGFEIPFNTVLFSNRVYKISYKA